MFDRAWPIGLIIAPWASDLSHCLTNIQASNYEEIKLHFVLVVSSFFLKIPSTP